MRLPGFTAANAAAIRAFAVYGSNRTSMQGKASKSTIQGMEGHERYANCTLTRPCSAKVLCLWQSQICGTGCATDYVNGIPGAAEKAEIIARRNCKGYAERCSLYMWIPCNWPQRAIPQA
jgi:hypothetical protein